jgi:hypothetical protein
MKTTPVREIDRGPVVNWLTDRALDMLSFLSGKLYPYALMYEVTFDKDDYDDEEDEESLHVCDNSCWRD